MHSVLSNEIYGLVLGDHCLLAESLGQVIQGCWVRSGEQIDVIPALGAGIGETF